MNLVDKQPIVILNGWGGQQFFWQNFLGNLSCEVKLIDTCDYLISDNLDEVASQIIKLIPNEAYVIGWSLGGQVALNIAAQYPDKIKKLITIGTNPKFIAQTDWPGMNETIFAGFCAKFMNNPIKALNYFFKLQLMGVKNLKHFIAQLPQVKNIEITKLKHGLQILKQADLRSMIQKINLPNLHIYGKQDHLVPHEISAHMKNMNSLSKVKIISAASHLPFFTNVDECYKIISEFLHE